jgi:glutathione peroxidase
MLPSAAARPAFSLPVAVVASALLLVGLASGALALGCQGTSEGSSASSDGGAQPATTDTAPTPRKVPPTGPADTPPPADPLTDLDAGDCTLEPSTFYGFTLQTLTYKDPVPTCRFKGKVLLVVNVASACTYTPQYDELQTLFQKYRAQGFYVLGFPSNTFNQETGTEAQISAFCTNTYKVTFPMFSIANVNPPNEQPLYTWLKAQPTYGAAIDWNFEKWILSRTGSVAKRIAPSTTPLSAEVTAAIEAELAK